MQYPVAGMPSTSVIPALSTQVAAYLRTVNAATMGHGAPGMISSLMANIAQNVDLAGLVETA